VLTDPTSYEETSGSGAIVGGMLKGIRMGILDESFKECAERGLAGICSKVAEDGTVLGVSAGTTVGYDADHYRNIIVRPMAYGQSLALVALVVWLENPKVSPVYVQTRVGRHGKEFKMYKFRTMIPNADKMKDSLMSQNEMAGPVFKIKDDPRITKVGKILRVTSLDELMQFFNVLKGDMSLVGPRPPLPREVKEYTDYQRLRLLATPGLTCTWQISKNRNDIPFDQWVEMDLEYIDKRSFLTDIAIILKTPIAMLSATGQ
jgi:lipopolysaccharide/colanic/teichoic acid biosynthesis glycosyltransferase